MNTRINELFDNVQLFTPCKKMHNIPNCIVNYNITCNIQRLDLGFDKYDIEKLQLSIPKKDRYIDCNDIGDLYFTGTTLSARRTIRFNNFEEFTNCSQEQLIEHINNNVSNDTIYNRHHDTDTCSIM